MSAGIAMFAAKIISMLIAFVVIAIALPSYAHAGGSTGSCNIIFSTTQNYTLGQNCTGSTLNVLDGVSQAKLYCAPGSSISAVVFGNNTYNNTLYNCTFADAKITSMKNARNNIISPYGSYNTSFFGNTSNLGIGYYFTFVPKGPTGNYSLQGFSAVMPDQLVIFNPGVGGSQQTNYTDIVQDAEQHNYTLPRFGDYPPGPVFLGPKSFALEVYKVYKNHTYDYNPYFFISPFWGWDELTFKVFNITSNMNFTPTLVYPRMTENVQFPDNTSIYWNYTVVKYSNATNMTFYFWSGYQVSPVGRIMHIVHNVTSGNYNFDRGIQEPGIHETIAVLKSPEFKEHDNSTTETYGVGLAFCTQEEPPLFMSGYYTMAQKYLGLLNTFFPSNQTCTNALDIVNSNIIINCEGGTINSTNNTIYLMNGNNDEFENCNIKGNAINALDSSNIRILNSTIMANNESNIPFVLNKSSLDLYSTKVYGYSKNPVLVNGATMHEYNTSFETVTTTIDYNSTIPTTTVQQSTNATAMPPTKIGNFVIGIYSHIIEMLLIFFFFVLILVALYVATARGMKNMEQGNKKR